MTPALLLDTHEAINELAKAGMPGSQAAVPVRQQVKLLEGGLAARSDVEDGRIDLEAEFKAVKADLDAVKVDVETPRQETAAAINAAKLELVRWLIGAMIAGGIGIAGVVIAAIKIV